jgi:hypothetical protein
VARRQNEYVKRRWSQLIDEFGDKADVDNCLARIEMLELPPVKFRGMGKHGTR